MLGTDLELDEAAEDVETIGGYLTTLAGRVPSRGELIRTPNGIEFEVMDADPRRIKRVRVQKTVSDTGVAASGTGTEAGTPRACLVRGPEERPGRRCRSGRLRPCHGA